MPGLLASRPRQEGCLGIKVAFPILRLGNLMETRRPGFDRPRAAGKRRGKAETNGSRRIPDRVDDTDWATQVGSREFPQPVANALGRRAISAAVACLPVRHTPARGFRNRAAPRAVRIWRKRRSPAVGRRCRASSSRPETFAARSPRCR